MTSIYILKYGTAMKSPYTLRVALGQTPSPLEVCLSSGCIVMSIQSHWSSVESSYSSSAESRNHISICCGIMVHPCWIYVRYFEESLVIKMKLLFLSLVHNFNLTPVITKSSISKSKELWWEAAYALFSLSGSISM